MNTEEKCPVCHEPADNPPTPASACYRASCTKCLRHRIDTPSIGRHMTLVDGKILCRGCAP